MTGKDAKFLSTLSLRRATAPAKAATNDGGDFYPRSPCGERPILGNPCAGCPAISIHALLAESDRPGRRSAHRHLPISIHALLAESDGATLSRTLLTALFLSTLSLRRATALGIHSPSTVIFLSTLSLRRATRHGRSARHTTIYFYPRSPCGERRGTKSYYGSAFKHFYPRSPCGERPPGAGRPHADQYISIHALLAESDCYAIFCGLTDTNFYPRSPCGERPTQGRANAARMGISIHALLAESDLSGTGTGPTVRKFLSTLSLRRATPPQESPPSRL